MWADCVFASITMHSIILCLLCVVIAHQFWSRFLGKVGYTVHSSPVTWPQCCPWYSLGCWTQSICCWRYIWSLPCTDHCLWEFLWCYGHHDPALDGMCTAQVDANKVQLGRFEIQYTAHVMMQIYKVWAFRCVATHQQRNGALVYLPYKT